jgi:hypothetical protein
VIGIALVGNVTSTFSVKDAVRILLSGLQAAPGYTDVSLRSICVLIGKVFEVVSHEVCSALQKGGVGQLIVVGRRPLDKSVEALTIALDLSDYPIKATVTELFSTGNVECFGSGTDAARKLLSSDASSPLHVLKAVVLDDNEPTVGGPIQYGFVGEEDFRVYGVRDYFPNHETKEIHIGFYVAGIELYTEHLSGDFRAFHIQRTIKLPFEADIDALLKQGYSIAAPQI